MKDIMRIIVVFLLIALALFLTIHIANSNMGVLNPKGVIALAEKNLLITAVSLMMIIIIPVFVMLAAVLIRYRAGNTKAKYRPDWHSNLWIEAGWWAVPTVIIIMLASITWTSTHELDPFRPIVSDVKPITIEVVALDWKWLFIYPEEGIASVNFLQFPKDVPINLKITADAPMNAFWIPQLAGQVYAMSGMTALLHLMATDEGEYKGLSSNFSGDGFSGMKFVAKVTTEEEYVKWVESVREASTTLSYERYEELAKPTKNHKVETYAHIEENLYTKIIMKFMAPMEMSDHEHYRMAVPNIATTTEKSPVAGTSSMETMGSMHHMESH